MRASDIFILQILLVIMSPECWDYFASTASPSHFGGIKPVRTHYPHKSNTLQLQSVTLIYSAPREREEYSIQQSDERMKKSAIQQALVCARQLLDDHDHDCAPSSSEFRSELLGKLLSSLLHQSVEIKCWNARQIKWSPCHISLSAARCLLVHTIHTNRTQIHHTRSPLP